MTPPRPLLLHRVAIASITLAAGACGDDSSLSNERLASNQDAIVEQACEMVSQCGSGGTMSDCSVGVPRGTELLDGMLQAAEDEEGCQEAVASWQDCQQEAVDHPGGFADPDCNPLGATVCVMERLQATRSCAPPRSGARRRLEDAIAAFSEMFCPWYSECIPEGYDYYYHDHDICLSETWSDHMRAYEGAAVSDACLSAIAAAYECNAQMPPSCEGDLDDPPPCGDKWREARAACGFPAED